MYLRSLFSFEVKGVSNDPVFGPVNTSLHKFLVNILLNIGTRACTTALSLIEEQSKVGLLHSPVHCTQQKNEYNVEASGLQHNIYKKKKTFYIFYTKM